MNDEVWVIEMIKKIFNNVFERNIDISIEEVKRKFAFDVILPKVVYDYTTGEETYAASSNGEKFITNDNLEKIDATRGWMQERRPLNSLQDIVDAWNKINPINTERTMDSINVLKSDTIYSCQNVYCSMDSSGSNGLIFCDSCTNSENLIASSRSFNCANSIRCDDSNGCSNSYNVVYSNKVINSLFIQNSFDLYECMFCSHIASKKFCIANMQFEEKEYYAIKKFIVDWILDFDTDKSML